MITETLTWHEVTERLPDDDVTVMICAPNLDEPIWLGWHDAGQWHDVSGMEIEGVVRWAEMPSGGLRA